MYPHILEVWHCAPQACSHSSVPSNASMGLLFDARTLPACGRRRISAHLYEALQPDSALEPTSLPRRRPRHWAASFVERRRQVL